MLSLETPRADLYKMVSLQAAKKQGQTVGGVIPTEGKMLHVTKW
jgi:hypothetical protein